MVQEESPLEKVHPPAWRRIVVWPLAALVRVWSMTIRIQASDEDFRVIRDLERPTLFLLWHNRLFIATELFARYRGGKALHSLVSASKDGAWLSAFFTALGMNVVRGSSSKRGREATAAMIEILRSGADTAITPDGPRGPVYEAKAGAAIVARRTGCRVVMVGADYESAWRLPSWDGFYLPRPFSTMRMRFVEFGPVTDERDPATRAIGARLDSINPDRKPIPLRTRESPSPNPPDQR